MAQGRGSALLVALAMMVLFHAGAANAATFTVGDNGGWTFNVVNWPNGKQFKAGDTLVFNYNSQIHNVVSVDDTGYSNCAPTNGAPVFQTGNDRITLAKGNNFFICGIPGHCQSGVKIAIKAA